MDIFETSSRVALRTEKCGVLVGTLKLMVDCDHVNYGNNSVAKYEEPSFLGILLKVAMFLNDAFPKRKYGLFKISNKFTVLFM